MADQPRTHAEIQVLRSIRDAWKARAAAQGWKPRTQRYAKHQLEFFLGVNAALTSSGSKSIEGVLLLLAVGRNIDELIGG